MRPSDSWHDDDRGAWGRPGWPHDDDRWADERESDPPGWGFPDSRSEWTSGGPAWSEIDPETVRDGGEAWPGAAFDDDPGEHSGPLIGDGAGASALGSVGSASDGRNMWVPGRRDSPDERERARSDRPSDDAGSASGDDTVSGPRHAGGLSGGSSRASSDADVWGAVGQASDGPRHADLFPGGDGGDGAAADDRPNPLDWGGLPDEEPAGRGRRGRRPKTGRAGRRASRRDDSNGGDPDEGDGLFGSDGVGGGSGGPSKRRGPFSEEQSSDPEARARGICLRLLTLAPRTRAQLAEALLKREIPAEVAERVLERFSEVGLIDDQAFAAMWVSSRHHGRGLARRALAQELRHRGVEEEMVKEAVERLDPDEEVETARRLVARKLGSTRGADPRARTRKLVGMLARKGYPAGLAFRIVREALEAEGEETSEEGGYLDSL